MSEYTDKKSKLARKVFSESVKNLIDITEDSNYEHMKSMTSLEYILQHRTLYIQAPRQIGKTSLIKELCGEERLRTILVVPNESYIGSVFEKRPKNVDIFTSRWVNGYDFCLTKSAHYDRIIFDECYSRESLERIVSRLNPSSSRCTCVIALGTMSGV